MKFSIISCSLRFSNLHSKLHPQIELIFIIRISPDNPVASRPRDKREKKQRLLSPYPRAYHLSPHPPPPFRERRGTNRSRLRRLQRVLGQVLVHGRREESYSVAWNEKFEFRAEPRGDGGRVAGGWDAPRGFLFPSLYEIDARHPFVSPLPSSSSRSCRSRDEEGWRGRERGRRALISPLAKSKNFTLGCVDAATPLWCFKLLKRATWAHNDVRASRERRVEREGKRCAGRCFEILSDWWMRLLREGKKEARGIREKDGHKTSISRPCSMFSFPCCPTPLSCIRPLFRPFLFLPCFFIRTCVPFLRNFNYVVYDRHDQCFLSRRRTDAWDRECNYSGFAIIMFKRKQKREEADVIDYREEKMINRSVYYVC